MPGFGENLKRLQDEAGLTNEQLARQADVQLRAVSRWRNTTDDDSFPRVDQLIRLADVFGVPLDQLVGREVPVRRRGGGGGTVSEPLVSPPGARPDLANGERPVQVTRRSRGRRRVG